jgi:hypothetical protein
MNIANMLDAKARTLAKTLKHTEGELLDVLIEMRRTRSFEALRWSGVWDYCVSKKGLGLSDSQAFYFKKVAEKSEQVPELKAAIDDGTLTLSQARRIVPVITPENHAAWIKMAVDETQKDLEHAVSEVNPNARPKERLKPTEMRLGITPALEKKFRHVQDLESQRQGRAVTLEETIEAMTELYLERKDPVRKAERVILSSRKPMKFAPPEPGRRHITAALGHAVRLRDGFQCTEPGCTQRRWLHLHHILAVADGGLNTLDNLRTVCSRHHAIHHAREPRSSAPRDPQPCLL